MSSLALLVLHSVQNATSWERCHVKKRRKSPELRAIPLLTQESLYVGIDVGKTAHVAGFLSSALLSRHQRFEACPVQSFENSRQGFRTLIDRMREFAPLAHCFVLLERTGHYHLALVQYLQELELPIYLVHVQARQPGVPKTDKRNALALANTLYTQLELGAQVANKLSLVRRADPPTPAAAQLKGLIRHRYELLRETTRRKNKLIALCDELFPEFTRVFTDPTLPTALNFREAFPTPQHVATASFAALSSVRKARRSFPSDAQLVELQRLACESIGVKDVIRLRALVLEQEQLVKELRLLRVLVEQLEGEIKTIIQQAREGQILISMGMGAIQAATIIAAIGNIHNFSRASEMKSFAGGLPSRSRRGFPMTARN